MLHTITIKGARVHNLRNLDLNIPRNSLVVITGPSGSGKSSLAFDTIYAEGQRRYVESLSTYARQFLDQLQKPDVDSIEGLSPSIAIEQKTPARSLRSTVGTITEIYDYLRVAFTRIGTINCHRCNSPISAQGTRQITDLVTTMPRGTKIQILSPLVMGRKGEYRKELDAVRRKGFIRARIDGELRDITQEITLNKHKRHDIDVVIDRLIIKPGIAKHVARAVTAATALAESVLVNIIDEDKDIFFSTKLACAQCGINYPEISPRFFSFNSPYGACPACRGMGFLDIGEEEEEVEGLEVCTECHGHRLNKEALSVRINGLNIGELSAQPIVSIASFLKKLHLTKTEKTITSKVFKEASERLFFLEKVGLGYLALNRPAVTLSSGEGQRIKLATQIGSSLTGVLYIFDEPSIGLHPRDCKKLLESLCRLRAMGNTVIVVEHDEDTMKIADHIIDMGPHAGKQGGAIVAEGSLKDIKKSKESSTGAFLRKTITIPVPDVRRKPGKALTIKDAREFNLNTITVKIPLGVFTCVTGVSGSGKSTLILEILYKALAKRLYGSRDMPGKHRSISGMQHIDKVIDIDQSPLGRTPRSNPATYTGLFAFIRTLFARIPESRVRGYKPGRFSFNVTGGRCEACRGDGLVKVSMHFLPDLYVPCETCKGARYNRETLAIRYKGKNISDVLHMTVSEALEFFHPIPQLRRKLATMEKVGLGYLQLGQPATTLSGGEAQRVKLSGELSKKATGNTLYILDEPTTGLHFVDIQKLLEVLHGLVDAGNSVLVIEHNLDVIKSADYIVDLGPEGGDGGGSIIACGTPEEVASVPASHTGRFLKKKLAEK